MKPYEIRRYLWNGIVIWHIVPDQVPQITIRNRFFDITLWNVYNHGCGMKIWIPRFFMFDIAWSGTVIPKHHLPPKGKWIRFQNLRNLKTDLTKQPSQLTK